MIKFVMPWIIFVLFSYVGLACASSNESILESGQYQANLYLQEIHQDPKGNVAVRLIWIPAMIEKLCVGNSFGECRNRDHCRTFRTVQKCDADLSHCVEVTHPDCLKFPAAPPTPPGSAPHRVLDHLLSDRKMVSELVKRWKLSLPNNGMVAQPTIEARYQTRATVKWEKWTNGENFSVLALSN